MRFVLLRLEPWFAFQAPSVLVDELGDLNASSQVDLHSTTRKTFVSIPDT